jgi:methyltransferase (TIGR00027 family)
MATFGAVARAVAARRGLVDDPFAEDLVRATEVDYFAGVIDDARYATDGDDNPAMAAFMQTLAMHCRFVDGFLAGAVKAGIRQVVILGSGLDTRPYRMWWPVGTTVYEMDQPEVIDFKTRVLRGLGASPNVNRCGVGVDLRHDWLGALRRAGFDASERTVWVAENLLVGYLPPAGQNRLLEEMTAASVVGSRFAADHIATWTPLQYEEGFAFIERWRQDGLDIDLDDLIYQGDYRYLPEYLASSGWQPVERNIVQLCSTLGLPPVRPVGRRDLELMPGYVTAERIRRIEAVRNVPTRQALELR